MSPTGQLLNDFRLTARLVNKETIRYSPAGQAILGCQLEHSGSVKEAGVDRKVELQISAVAIGSEVQTLDQMQIGQVANFQGFIAHQSIRRQALVFHITNISL
jgi:primosomal replication protein N